MAQNSEVISVTELSYLKVRTIARSPKCPTRQLSYLMDLLIKQFVKEAQIIYQRQHRTNFLNKCQQEVREKTKIITFDVVSLYANIPHNVVIEAINNYVTKYETNLYPRFNKKIILESVEFILKTTH